MQGTKHKGQFKKNELIKINKWNNLCSIYFNKLLTSKSYKYRQKLYSPGEPWGPWKRTKRNNNQGHLHLQKKQKFIYLTQLLTLYMLQQNNNSPFRTKTYLRKSVENYYGQTHKMHFWIHYRLPRYRSIKCLCVSDEFSCRLVKNVIITLY